MLLVLSLLLFAARVGAFSNGEQQIPYNWALSLTHTQVILFFLIHVQIGLATPCDALGNYGKYLRAQAITLMLITNPNPYNFFSFFRLFILGFK